MKRYLKLTLYGILYAVGFQLFIVPNFLALGGFSGVSVLLNHVIPAIPTGTFILMLNIPILIIGFWKFGAKFTISTCYCVVLTSVLMTLLEYFAKPIVSDDVFLGCVCGGAIVGFSLGKIFRHGATTGGMDIVVKLIRLKVPHLKTNQVFLIADSFVVAAMILLMHDVVRGLYSAICIVISTTIMERALYGKDEATFVHIISDKPQEVADQLLYELQMGVTFIDGMGAYTKKDKKIIMCVAKKRDFYKVEAVVKKTDPKSFMIVSSAQEVFGEGYKQHTDSI
ncbi:MAG: YitT family protein [Lachnospiraceae bacterium]|nr:YitT family protein [Lachnospiraceae bacterium]